MNDWLTEERLVLYPRALLLALGMAVLLAALISPTPGGDYPCFWAAGRLVWQGVSPYDAAALRALEDPWIPGDGWLPFAYPPAVALLHAALAWLPYRLAWLIWTGLAALALAAIPCVLAPVLPIATARPSLALVALLWYPGLRALLGGQGTPVLALLLALAVRALHDGRSLLAGLAAGLALLKPTIGLPLVGLVGLAGGWWAALGSALAAAGVWLGSAAVMGPGWISAFLSNAGTFFGEAQRVEGAGNVGLLGTAEHLLGYGEPGPMIAGGLAAVLVALGLVALWCWPCPWPARLGATALALPLLPPHSLWYDAGLGGLAILALAEARQPPALLVALWALGASALFARTLGVQPLVPLLLVGMVLVVATARSGWPARPPAA